MNALVDMTGMMVNNVQVIERDGFRGGKPAWACRCACGALFQAVGTSLRKGKTRACPECSKASVIASVTKHGGVGSREYVRYHAMKQRCYDKNNKRFHRYGGRGIVVCERWLESFANFLADMGPLPSPEHSIERLDRDKGYEPGNCVWATRHEQANNRCNNTLIEIDGRTQTMTKWSKETGVNRTVILRRMNRGLSGEALIRKANSR